jgi:hypothetical protein
MNTQTATEKFNGTEIQFAFYTQQTFTYRGSTPGHTIEVEFKMNANEMYNALRHNKEELDIADADHVIIRDVTDSIVYEKGEY